MTSRRIAMYPGIIFSGKICSSKLVLLSYHLTTDSLKQQNNRLRLFLQNAGVVSKANESVVLSLSKCELCPNVYRFVYRQLLHFDKLSVTIAGNLRQRHFLLFSCCVYSWFFLFLKQIVESILNGLFRFLLGAINTA